MQTTSRFIYVTLLGLIFTGFLNAQNGSWWHPDNPFVGDTLTIYFDPSQNGEIPDNPSSLVLHWGVNEIGTGNWQAPPEQLRPPGTVMDGIAARTPFTLGTGGVWSVRIPTDTTLQTVHYVVNTGTPSNPGSSWGHNTGGANWNITLLEAIITVVVVEPQVQVLYQDPLRSPYFASAGDTVPVVITSVTNSSQADSLSLLINDELVAHTPQDTLADEFIMDDVAGVQHLQGIVVDTAGIADTAAFVIMVNPPPDNEPPPEGTRPGIVYTDINSVTLSLFAPEKEFVYVIGDFNNWRVDTNFFMHRYQPSQDSTLWWLSIDDLSIGTEYAFQYLVDGHLRIADPYTDKVLDPWNDPWIPDETYPNLKSYPDGKTREPVAVLQTGQNEFNWTYSDTFQTPDKKDLVIYEMLLRDFINRHDYQTLIDTLDYLENLGINAIELMPVNEFEGNSSWGYNSSFYFAPDKYYGTRHALKALIDECHRRGIAVLIDMVLNHSYGQSPLVRLYWDDLNNRPAANNPWYNQVSPNPVFAWGYDFDHESPHTQYFVDRVNSYWITEYKVDGFRFDFTKGLTNTGGDGWAYDAARIAILERMADEIWAVDNSTVIILEHFAENSEEIALANYGMLLWGNTNYNYNEATMGWNANSDFSWGYYESRGWSVPHLVTYMESHDKERLMFKNLQYGNSSGDYDIQELSTALNRMKLAGAFFLTLPGPKMIWQFGELGYDVSIDDPCRVCEKPIRWNYFQNEDRRKLYKTWQALLRLRNNHELFRRTDTDVDLWLGSSTGKKRIRLSGNNMEAVIIGNFSVVPLDIEPDFHHAGIWYDYFSGDSFTVTNVHDQVTLAAGEFHIYTDQPLETPEPGLLFTTPETGTVPLTFGLSQNYPNPFNPETRIHFSLPTDGQVTLTVYDLLGKTVRTLVDEIRPAGRYYIQWDGTNHVGKPVSSGVYLYRLESGGKTELKKLVVIR